MGEKLGEGLEGRSFKFWLLILLFSGAIVRVALLNVYEPFSAPDTGTYWASAKELAGSPPDDYTPGRRTPGYPVFLLLIGPDEHRIIAVQMALGLLTSFALFLIGLRLIGNPMLAFLVAAAHEFNIQQLLLAGALMTETLTTFLLVAMTLGLMVILDRLQQGDSVVSLALLVGLVAAAAIMVRPQYLYLGALLPALVLYAGSGWRWPSRRIVLHALAIAVPVGVAVLGWAKLVEKQSGYFALSTQSGFGLVNHSVEFIELAPPQYSQVRDILLRYRAERVEASGHAGNTVWYAWPEIQLTTGWTLPEASGHFQTMSKEMFMKHPDKYALSVVRPWVEFWTVPLIWDRRGVTSEEVAERIQSIWNVQHPLLRLANAAFLALAALTIFVKSMRPSVSLFAVGAIIFGSSLLQALADRGAGSRYAVSVQALVIVCLAAMLCRLYVRKGIAADAQGGVPTSYRQ